MKKFKLFIASLVVSCFFFTTNVNAQAKVWDDTIYVEQYAPCLGEVLTGVVYRHIVENDKFRNIHLNGDFIGKNTGKSYKIVGFHKFPPGEFSTNRDTSVKIIGEDGLVQMVRIVTATDNTLTIKCY